MKIPIIGKLFEKRMFSLAQMDEAMDKLINGRPSVTGVSVTPDSANSLVSYFAGKRLIAETVGQIPLVEYRQLQPRGKTRAIDRILYGLLHDSPNPEMDAISFKEAMTENAIGWGNAFAEIEWDSNGTPIALWPLLVNKMKVGRDKDTKKIIYAYTMPDGTTSMLPAYRVWHLKGFSPDGMIGYDTVYLMREAIAMGMAMEEYGARFFGNGANPGGVLEHPNKLSQPAQDNLRKSWNEMHQGLTNQHRIAILEEGMTYKPTGIPNDNAQFLESRKFQVVEIARLLHIPPHMLAEMDRATFSNIEHQGLEYLIYTMEPWFMRWEQTCNRKLLQPWERKVFFCEFLRNALLRGDTTARADYYTKRFYLGSLSPNDIRELENENPIDDPNGDKYFVQSNMVPIDMAGKQQQPPPAVEPVPAADANKIDKVVRSIADRDKANILKGYRKDPAKFPEFAEDYFRDFPNYMLKELTEGSNHKETQT